MHLTNVEKGIIYTEPIKENREVKRDFKMEDYIHLNFLESHNIEEENNFKNGTSIKYVKNGKYKEIDVRGFKEIAECYHAHFKKPFKYYLGITAHFQKLLNYNDDKDFIDIHFTTNPKNIVNIAEFTGFTDEINELYKRIEETELEGSGWCFLYITNISLNIGTYRSPVGGTYIELPFKSGVILNIQNEKDNLCFVWSILAYLHPFSSTQHAYRVNKYKPFLKEINLDGIEFPINIDSIKKFHKQNPQILFNVWEINDEKK